MIYKIHLFFRLEDGMKVHPNTPKIVSIEVDLCEMKLQNVREMKENGPKLEQQQEQWNECEACANRGSREPVIRQFLPLEIKCCMVSTNTLSLVNAWMKTNTFR